MIIKFKQPRQRRFPITEGLVMAVLAVACAAQIAVSLVQGREMVQRINEMATTASTPANAAHPVTAVSCLAKTILESQ